MPVKKIIAYNITNLTDARYFAARQVDFLLFDLSYIRIPQILEIQDWIAGPELLLLFGQDALDLIDEALLKIKPAFFSIKDNSSIDLSHLQPHFKLFHQTVRDDKIEIIIGEERYSSYSGSPDNLISYLEKHDLDGVIISGLKEAKIGIQSFDHLDAILDVISE